MATRRSLGRQGPGRPADDLLLTTVQQRQLAPGAREEAEMAKLPESYLQFTKAHPGVARSYEALGEACAKAGPLDAKTRELVKLGLAIGGRLEGGVHSHARRALEGGATPAEVRHAVALAVTTVGFPTAVAAWTWVEDVLSGAKGKAR
jgi:4-carboxymuconolactone decarboxylase